MILSARRARLAIHAMRAGLLLLVLTWALRGYAGSSEGKNLSDADLFTSEEKAWLNAHPVLEFISVKDHPPYCFDEEAHFSGISADFNARLGKALGVQVRTTGIPHNEYWAAGRSGKYHAMFPTVKGLKQVSAEFLQSEHVFTAYTYAFVRQGAQISVRRMEDLRGLKVGYLGAIVDLQELLADKPEIASVPFSNHKALLSALVEGRIDVVLGYVDIQWEILSNALFVKLEHVFERSLRQVVYSVPRNQAILVGIINKGLNTISERERHSIIGKWAPYSFEKTVDGMTGLDLSESERKWLARHPVIRVGSDAAWKPIEFRDALGDYQGISIDYLRKVESQLGVRFEMVTARDWNELIEQAKRGQVDVFSAMTPTPEREQYLSFTTSYLSFPIKVFVRNEAVYVGSVDELSGRKVAVVDGYAIEDFLRRDYPSMTLVPVSSIREGIARLESGRVDAFIGNLLTTGIEIAEHGHSGIKVGGDTSYLNDLGMGVRNDWPIFTQILDKVLKSIPIEEREEIYRRWVPLMVERSPDYSYVWKIALPLLFLLAVFLFLTVVLRKQVARQTSSLKLNEQAMTRLVAASGVLGHDTFFQSMTLAFQEVSGADQAFIARVNDDDMVTTIARASKDGIEDNITYSLNDSPFVDAAGKARCVQMRGKAPFVPKDELIDEMAGEEFVMAPMFDSEGRGIGIVALLFDRRAPDALNLRDLVELFAHSIGSEMMRMDAEQERERLGHAVDQAGESILMTERSGHILYTNPAFTETTGFEREDILGHPLVELIDTSNGDGARELEAAFNGEKEWQGELLARKEDETSFPITVTLSPVRNSSGIVTNFVAIARDKTRERALEQRIRHSEKMEAIGQLAGGIAHDFNNMLGGILGFADLSLRNTPTGSKEAQNLAQIINAAERAEHLVEQILSFSRKTPVRRVPLHVNPVVTEAIGLLRASLPSSVEIRTELMTETAPVLADATQLHEIVMNLCTNGSHAMGEMGVLKVRTWEERVEVERDGCIGPLLPGFYSVIDVEDDGPGIHPTAREKIFEPFFTTKAVGEGTGMGLSVVFGIVCSYKGNIVIDSTLGRGTKFSVYLLKSLEQVTPVLRDLPILVPGNERVMLVEDEEFLLEAGSAQLTEIGYTVKPFSCSQAALTAFEAAPQEVDLLITDQTMPKITGLELAAQIREIRPDLPMILVTGYSKSVDDEIATKSGFSGVLNKPYRITLLSRVIRDVLDQGSGTD